MKNSILITLTLTLIMSSCNTDMSNKTIGFVTGDNADLKWHLGTQDAVDVVIAVTKLGNTIILDRLTGKPIYDFHLFIVHHYCLFIFVYQ